MPASLAHSMAWMVRAQAPGSPRKAVVNLGSRAVQRNGQSDQTGLLELEDGLARQQRRGAGSQRHMHALAGGVADQLEDVRPLQRVAAGQDEDGHMQGGNLVDQRLSFGVGQLVGVGEGLGGGAAVLAGQIAGLRDLPDGQKRGFVIIQAAASGDIAHRFHETSSETGRKPDGEKALSREKTVQQHHNSNPEGQPRQRTKCD